jgi:hypothetical protein
MRKQKKTKKPINLSRTAWDMAGNKFVDQMSYSDIGWNFGVSRQRAYQQVAKVRQAILFS